MGKTRCKQGLLLSDAEEGGGELICEFSWPARGVVEIAFKD